MGGRGWSWGKVYKEKTRYKVVGEYSMEFPKAVIVFIANIMHWLTHVLLFCDWFLYWGLRYCCCCCCCYLLLTNAVSLLGFVAVTLRGRDGR